MKSTADWSVKVKEGTPPTSQTAYVTAIWHQGKPDEFRHSEWVNIERNIAEFVAHAKGALARHLTGLKREGRTIEDIEAAIRTALSV